MPYYAIEYSDHLSHHGILGQKWGDRNGPPYPLDAGDHSASEKKAGYTKSIKKESKLIDKTVKKVNKNNAQVSVKKYASSYATASKVVQEKSKTLKPLADNFINLYNDASDYEFSTDSIFKIADKLAEKYAREDDAKFDTYSKTKKREIMDKILSDRDVYSEAMTQFEKTDPEYKNLKSKAESAYKEYSDACKTMANEIIGVYGDTIVSSNQTSTTYHEIVADALDQAVADYINRNTSNF